MDSAPGTPLVHFDVTDPVRARAIRLGAKPITIRESGDLIRATPRRARPHRQE